MHSMPPSVQQHIEPRVAERLDHEAVQDQQGAAHALRELGFSVFHGGVCDAVVDAHGGYERHQN